MRKTASKQATKVLYPYHLSLKTPQQGAEKDPLVPQCLLQKRDQGGYPTFSPKNFPNQQRETDIQIYEAQSFLNNLNLKRSTQKSYCNQVIKR